MGKALIFCTILLTAALFVGGLFFSNNSLMWLGATSLDFSIVRGIIIVLLTILLFTNPPRNVLLRAVLAISSIALLAWVSVEIYTYSILVLDVGIFMLASVILAIEALEPRLETMEENTQAFIDSLDSSGREHNIEANVLTISSPSTPILSPRRIFSGLSNSQLIYKAVYLHLVNEELRHGS